MPIALTGVITHTLLKPFPYIFTSSSFTYISWAHLPNKLLEVLVSEFAARGTQNKISRKIRPEKHPLDQTVRLIGDLNEVFAKE